MSMFNINERMISAVERALTTLYQFGISNPNFENPSLHGNSLTSMFGVGSPEFNPRIASRPALLSHRRILWEWWVAGCQSSSFFLSLQCLRSYRGLSEGLNPLTHVPLTVNQGRDEFSSLLQVCLAPQTLISNLLELITCWMQTSREK